MKIKILFLLFVVLKLSAQKVRLFSETPDIGAIKNQSQFKEIAVDSHSIFILGNEVVKQDSDGRNKIVKIHLSEFNYAGDLNKTSIIEDTSLNLPFLSSNLPMYKVNDSIYITHFYTVPIGGGNWAENYIVKLNVFQGKVIQTKKLIRPISGDFGMALYSSSKISNGRLIFAFVFNDGIKDSDLIYDFDINTLDYKRIKAQIPDSIYQVIRYIENSENNEYLIVGDILKSIDNDTKVDNDLFFLKLDSLGNILKRIVYNTKENLGFGSGGAHTIARMDDGSIMLGVSGENYSPDYITSIPYALHMSGEFDTLLNQSKLMDNQFNENTTLFFLYGTNKLFDGSGVLYCGALYGFGVDEPEFGIIAKVNNYGDTLWSRKLVPLGWENDRANYMDLTHIYSTYYNTIIVCGKVSDSYDSQVKGWLLQLDSNGCIVPNCEKHVGTTELSDNEKNAFKIFPNILKNGNLFLLANINDNNYYEILITDSRGITVLKSKFQPISGVQYILNIPEKICDGEYFVSIKGTKYLQSEKLIITRTE